MYQNSNRKIMEPKIRPESIGSKNGWIQTHAFLEKDQELGHMVVHS